MIREGKLGVFLLLIMQLNPRNISLIILCFLFVVVESRPRLLDAVSLIRQLQS